jgi:small subunit ribosomal protein S4
VNIPSYLVKMGDVVSIRHKSKSLEVINDSMSQNNSIIEWLEWDASSLKGKLINVPNRDQIPENIKEQLIVELYSK